VTGSATAAAIDRIADAGVIAVVHAPSAEGAVRAGLALAAGGVRGIEITFTTPDAAAAIARLREADGDLLVGAGTVTSAEHLSAAVAAGATFAVSPHTNPALAMVADEEGVLYLPGALTPTEVVQAAELAPVVKLFPASLGGTAYLKTLLAPLPAIRIVPTGGVTAANVGEWLVAGALAVGAGGELCPGGLIADGRFDAITQRARSFADALAEHREGRR
jgi:2-dehydro-3-deoxyphosphogluconate aldolase / (4S)-4-hydroxy-2-oxoglutarate aldolase